MFNLFNKKRKDFTARVNNSGIEFSIKKGKNLLTAALEENIQWPHKCRVGSCGSCKYRLIKGKISPDIDNNDIGRIVELVKSQKIQGVIVSNTTDNNRENLSDIKKNEVGGLSGRPLKDISTNLIKKFYKETKGEVQIIGVGGVDSGQSAFEKITAGANAVQLYTGMVYKGPGIVKEIKKDLISILKKENLKNVSEAVGINA